MMTGRVSGHVILVYRPEAAMEVQDRVVIVTGGGPKDAWDDARESECGGFESWVRSMATIPR
jgi:hypothetical protein